MIDSNPIWIAYSIFNAIKKLFTVSFLLDLFHEVFNADHCVDGLSVYLFTKDFK